MDRFTIKFADVVSNGKCPLCGEVALTRKGPRLTVEDRPEAVCRDCGKRHVPNLVALLDLANIADRVGKQCRHLLTPPMGGLLDLARAAENYSYSAPMLRARAG